MRVNVQPNSKETLSLAFTYEILKLIYGRIGYEQRNLFCDNGRRDR